MLATFLSGCLCGSTLPATTSMAVAAGSKNHEVWAIDQSNSAGKSYGGTLYIYDGSDLERGRLGGRAVPGIIDLSGAASARRFELTGVNPVRPHMIAMNPSQTHAIISFVATGHVLWIAERGRNFMWVIDAATDEVVNQIPLVGAASDDPTPDLLATSPNGSHVFVSLRGPNPLTADPRVSTGSTPGVGVIKVTEGGRGGIFESVAPATNVDSSGLERADVHALTIRLR
jgi:hypothetical protein